MQNNEMSAGTNAGKSTTADVLNVSQTIANALLPAVPVVNPKDAEGNPLHEGDRVYSYDHTDNGYQRVYGTLQISDTKETFGHWCVEYDDGESFMVLDFNNVWSARLA